MTDQLTEPKLSRRSALWGAGLLSLVPKMLFAPSPARERPAGPTSGIFSDVTQTSGITWRHMGGFSPDRFLIETMGGGVAFLDFDNDGLLDIFLVTGGETPNGKNSVPPRNGLYRNLGNGRFIDVALRAGVDRIPFYGMGAFAADFDNDGHQDLLVTGYPSLALLHNSGDGTFTDITDKSGLNNRGRWSTGAAWFDYDRDGYLDLFICNYARFSFDDHKLCTFNGVNTYCAQTAYEGDSPALFHNNGDGTFTDVSERAGLSGLMGRALGVVSIDFDDDGWPDLFVARDASPNLLLRNRRDGSFQDVAMDAEVALNADGTARAGMGVDSGDVDGNGRPDFVVTNFNDEYHALYLNRGPFPFREWSIESGLARYTRSYVGWGVHFVDYDGDGRLDLIIANGHINEVIEKMRSDVPYKCPPLLLRNVGSAVFENASHLAGPVFRTRYLGRGLAVGDYDNNGAPDCVFTCLGDRPVLLRNNLAGKNTWLGIQLRGTRSNRDGIGAKVTVSTPGKKLVRWVTSGSSYLSSHDKRLLFGLADLNPTESVDVEVRWPNGDVQRVAALTVNRYHTIVESQGEKR